LFFQGRIQVWKEAPEPNPIEEQKRLYQKETHMTTPTIEPGLKGTLSPEEYTTRAMPHWGETYLPAMARYGNMDYVSIAFATDADKAAALIPKELQLVNIPALSGQAAANLVFAKYRECDPGGTEDHRVRHDCTISTMYKEPLL
jgi:hypothetical protein